MSEVVRLETGQAEGVATLRLDNPKRNSLDEELLTGFHQAVGELSRRTDIRVVVLWGGPRVFSLGADIDLLNGLDVNGGRDLSRRFNTIFRDFELLPQITVSAVNGYALGGGCELAMASDFRLIGEGAVLGSRRSNWGPSPARAEPRGWAAWWASQRPKS